MPQPAMEMKLDLRAFNRTLKDYADVRSKKTNEEIVNEKLKFIAIEAARSTKKASRASIASFLRRRAVAGARVIKSGKNAGQTRILRSGRKVPIGDGRDSILRRLALGAIAKNQGGNRGDIPWSEQERMMDKLFKSYMRGIGYVKAGWIAAARKSPAWVKGKRPPKDYAVPAHGRFQKAKTIIGNTAGFIASLSIQPMTKHSKKPGKPQSFAMAGLKAGIAKELRGMQQYMARKHAEAIRKHKWK